MTGAHREEDAFAIVEAQLASVHPVLHQAELALADLGVGVAPLYLASARGSLHHVSSCLAHHCAGRAFKRGEPEIVDGSGIRLRPVRGHAGLAQRHRASGRGQPEIAAWPRRPDLGADLVTSGEAADFCSGPVGSTLLFCALAHHRWLHHATRTKWSTDVSGAQALVTAINGGAGCAIPVHGPLVQLVDAEVVAMLAMLGWTRMLSPGMPAQGDHQAVG